MTRLTEAECTPPEAIVGQGEDRLKEKNDVEWKPPTYGVIASNSTDNNFGTKSDGMGPSTVS
ncbi:MAG: hypothetical protein ABFS56_32845 [Pseudomonadota bacterium]